MALLLGLSVATSACTGGPSETTTDQSSTKRPASAEMGTPSDDIVPFDGTGGPTGVSVSPAEDHAVAIPSDLATPIGSRCSQSFPPPASLPCAVPEGGNNTYYVSPKGDDANDGASPAHAWATLFHAVKMALPISTIRVAEGVYTSADVVVDQPLIIKGGFDASFAAWDPDRHPAIFLGKLALAHDQAIWAGFHLVSRSSGSSSESGESGESVETRHMISGGTLLRNYVEIAYRASADQTALYGIVAGASQGHRTRLVCNDVYVRGEGVVSSAPSLDVRAITYDGAATFSGEAVLASNRVCVDHAAGVLSAEAVGGSANGDSTSSVALMTMTNNLIEAHGDTALGLRAVLGVRFSGGELPTNDLDVIATNNTIFSETDGIVGEVLGGGSVHWRLTNNVVFSTTGRQGINVGPQGSARVDIVESSGNLVFGFVHNAIIPAPKTSRNDDTSGGWKMSDVLGELFSPNAAGPAFLNAVNVFGDPTYGGVRTDLSRTARPSSGTWTRGAIQQ